MKVVTAAEAMDMDGQKIISTQDDLMINLEDGDVMSGVFNIISMDVDPDSPIGELIVTVIDATPHVVGPEILCSLSKTALVVVDINF